jgi:hypothetical protein
MPATEFAASTPELAAGGVVDWVGRIDGNTIVNAGYLGIRSMSGGRMDLDNPSKAVGSALQIVERL